MFCIYGTHTQMCSILLCSITTSFIGNIFYSERVGSDRDMVDRGSLDVSLDQLLAAQRRNTHTHTHKKFCRCPHNNIAEYRLDDTWWHHVAVQFLRWLPTLVWCENTNHPGQNFAWQTSAVTSLNPYRIAPTDISMLVFLFFFLYLCRAVCTIPSGTFKPRHCCVPTTVYRFFFSPRS